MSWADEVGVRELAEPVGRGRPGRHPDDEPAAGLGPLLQIDRRVPDLGSRARVAVIIAVAATAFNHLGEPIYWHHDWPHFLYLFIADSVMLATAGIIVAWFLPKARAAPTDAPVEV